MKLEGKLQEGDPIHFLRLKALSSCVTVIQWKHSFFMFFKREPAKSNQNTQKARQYRLNQVNYLRHVTLKKIMESKK